MNEAGRLAAVALPWESRLSCAEEGKMADEFLIDGMLSGTGIRDAIVGGYVDPKSLGLSESLASHLASWQARYEEAHFAGFPDDRVAELDRDGSALASMVREERPGAKVGYFSNGLMKRLD